MTNKTRWLLDRVLEGLRYPAQKWQILAQADINGVDTVTRERLCGLPERVYHDNGEVASILDSLARDR